MAKQVAAIAFIYVCTCVGWIVLGATVLERTYSSDASLGGRVVSTWGAPHNQAPPDASCEKTVIRTVEQNEGGRTVVTKEEEKTTVLLPLESSLIDVALDLEHRQKGLLWYNTYKVAFAGEYSFRNTSDEQRVTFSLRFPTTKTIYDDFSLSIDGVPLSVTNTQDVARATALVPPGDIVRLKVAYRSQGLDEWRYRFGDQVAQVRDLHLRIRTNFKEIDFPESTLSPTEKRVTAEGWDLLWDYTNLLSGYQVGVAMPEKLQPGPLAGRISFFAPVSLLFFFFLMFIITTLRSVELHPMNYFFLAAGFFSFHLLLAYLVDHISIHVAFAVSAAASIFLVISYLRLVTGIRFAAIEAGLAQFIYLVMFSYAFFFKGLTGLAITLGSVLTLFVVMQMTGRIRWSERFAAKGQPHILDTTPGRKIES